MAEAAMDLVIEILGTGGDNMSANTTLMEEVVDFFDKHPQIRANVTKNIGAHSKMAIDPRAVEAMQKEMNKLIKLGAWD